MLNKKEVVQEVPIKEQLTRTELECLYRHLKMFIQVVWDEKENVSDACIGCNHYCSNNECVFDPWPTFYKIAELAENIK